MRSLIIFMTVAAATPALSNNIDEFGNTYAQTQSHDNFSYINPPAEELTPAKQKNSEFLSAMLARLWQEDIPQNEEEAFKWCLNAAESGNVDAQAHMAWAYQFGLGAPQNYEEAFKWYLAAAEQGDIISQETVAQMYEFGKGVPQSDEAALKWYHAVVENGKAKTKENPWAGNDPLVLDSQTRIAQMYKVGKGVPQSDEEALKWYQAAAEGKSIDACINIGWMHEFGKGVPQSDEEALKWYHKAVERGYEQGRDFAEHFISGIYFTDLLAQKYGALTEDQYVNALYDRLIESYDEGYLKFYIGVMYAFGEGLNQNDTEALKWYYKAAELDNLEAYMSIGNMHELGKGGFPQNQDEALNWYRKAAEQYDKKGYHDL